MANDLERFLQQAAERLAQKAGNRGAASPRPSASLPSAARQNSAQPPLAEVVTAEVIDTGSRLGNLRESGPDPLSTIDTRPALAQDISQADERMLDHVHQTFDHQLSNLKAASSSLSTQTSKTNRPSESPIVEMLRNPNSLRNAFIASEIFKRK